MVLLRLFLFSCKSLVDYLSLQKIETSTSKLPQTTFLHGLPTIIVTPILIFTKIISMICYGCSKESKIAQTFDFISDVFVCIWSMSCIVFGDVPFETELAALVYSTFNLKIIKDLYKRKKQEMNAKYPWTRKLFI